VRSYFLNEIDGLKSNDGILMVGSTNHLDQLDPGIAKRPSRFDRKYYFPDPSLPQRAAYARFWQAKLADNEDVEFPHDMCEAVAKITDGFSFAYMQEAFIAALLALAGREAEEEKEGNSGGKCYAGEGGPSTTAQSGLHGTAQWPLESPKVGGGGGGDDELEKFPLWRELKRQVKILKEEMDRATNEPDHNGSEFAMRRGQGRIVPELRVGDRDAYVYDDDDYLDMEM